MPPRLAEEILAWLLPGPEAAEVLLDLRELYRFRERDHGTRAARWWYYRQIVSFGWRFKASGLLRPRPEAVVRDVRHAARAFARSPGFTAVVVATLALGIGANVFVWSVVDQVVRRPLGFVEEERLVRVWPEHRLTRERFDQLRSRTQSFELFSAYMRTALTWTGDGPPSVLTALEVTYEHFELFGAAPVLGRAFRQEDSQPGAEAVVILSHEVWQERFGGDQAVLGSRLALDEPRIIVGVMSQGFEPRGEREELWIPVRIDPLDEGSYSHMANLSVAARLKDGASAETGRAELESIAMSIEPPFYRLDDVPTFSVRSYREDLVGEVRPMLMLLSGATALVLLLCCVNVTNLLLAKGVTRTRELAVRRAMGAGRWRVCAQLLTENVVLGLMGGVGGLGLVWTLGPLLLDRVRSELPRGDHVAMDGGAVLWSVGLSVLAAVGFGLLPSWRLSAAGRGASSARGTQGKASRRLSRGLVAAEVALALVVVAAAGLLGKSFWLLQRVEPGLRPGGVVTMRVSPSPTKYDEEAARVRYFEAVGEALLATPGVARVGGIQILPLTTAFMGVGYSPDGAAMPPGVPPPVASYRVVTAGYREAMGIALIEGRDLDPTDGRDRESVGLINETLARELWPGESAVGRQVRYEDGSAWFRVVGVVGDVHQNRLEHAPGAEVYVPIAQDSWPVSMFLVARVAKGPPENAVAELRQAVWSVDADVPITNVRTMDAVLSHSMRSPRGRTLLFAGFGLLALLLSVVGVYGVTAHTVRQRTTELNIRMTLGATSGQVVTECLRDGLVPVTIGLGVGWVGAILGSRALSGFLFEVGSVDIAVYGAVGALLGLCAGAAILVPATRAARFRPAVVLHADD